jgi:hypothetical protein
MDDPLDYGNYSSLKMRFYANLTPKTVVFLVLFFEIVRLLHPDVEVFKIDLISRSGNYF